MATEVVNIKHNMEYDVYIGRGSLYGNPFRIGCCGRGPNRQEVINKYREWIVQQPKLMAKLCELKDKRLGCYCAPLACHGHVLVELIEKHCS